MCNDCCTQFKGWCKSFTTTETYLCILESILLVIFTVFLGFVILHFLACPRKDIKAHEVPTTVVYPQGFEVSTEENENLNVSENGSVTLGPGIKCTWKPSQKTTAQHYYEQSINPRTNGSGYAYTMPATPSAIELDTFDSDEQEAEDDYKQFILALVKVRSLQEIIFGCILIIVSDFWVLTAASCIEAIEEVDSLDYFVIMEGYGETQRGRIHTVADVQIHPWYQGTNKSYDVVALKSEDELVTGGKRPVDLPVPLDYAVITIGEKLTLVGYGGYRRVDASRSAHRAATRLVAGARCAAELWAPRHLSRVDAVRRQRALCAGGGTGACNYCAGTPLLARRTLLGLMSDNPHCGLGCEPALFVSVALVRDWLDSLAANNTAELSPRTDNQVENV